MDEWKIDISFEEFTEIQNRIMTALASICVGEFTPAICDLAQALAIMDDKI